MRAESHVAKHNDLSNASGFGALHLTTIVIHVLASQPVCTYVGRTAALDTKCRARFMMTAVYIAEALHALSARSLEMVMLAQAFPYGLCHSSPSKTSGNVRQ